MMNPVTSSNAAAQMGQQLASAPIDWRIATIYTDTDREVSRVMSPRPFTRSISPVQAGRSGVWGVPRWAKLGMGTSMVRGPPGRSSYNFV